MNRANEWSHEGRETGDHYAEPAFEDPQYLVSALRAAM